MALQGLTVIRQGRDQWCSQLCSTDISIMGTAAKQNSYKMTYQAGQVYIL